MLMVCPHLEPAEDLTFAESLRTCRVAADDPEVFSVVITRERIRAVKRASQLLRAGAGHATEAIDRVVFDAGERYRRRIVMTSERGGRILLDLPEAMALRAGDVLLPDGGTIVAVVATPEPLIEIAANGAAEQRGHGEGGGRG
jgi:UreE urease accessory protein, N-terminal domain